MSELETKTGLSVKRDRFGKMPDGTPIDVFTLTNAHGMKVKILNYGAIISECWVPDRYGKLDNVVLGFDNLEQYLAKHPRFGSTIGRYANRISNAEFELDGVTYRLQANKGTSTIHGGNVGFDKRVWDIVSSGCTEFEAAVKLHYFSPDMEEGFPGDLDVSISFSINNDNSLFIRYNSKTGKTAAPVNLTNHSYFNLQGAGNGNILNHIASFNADYYTPLNDESVPTGEIASVVGTPFDFRERTVIGSRIEEAGGYDLNYIIKMRPGDIEGIGSVLDPESGRILTAYTDRPAFQFFTANGLDGSIVGIGGKYQRYAGFCIETQAYPDSLNHKNFPSTILPANSELNSLTQYSFSNLP